MFNEILAEESARDIVMHPGMGGEIAEFLNEWQGKTIRCFGVCRTDQVMDVFM